jgi:Ca2+/H+ antiporter
MTFDAFCAFVIKEALDQSSFRGTSSVDVNIPRRRSVQSMYSISGMDWDKQQFNSEAESDDDSDGDEEEDVPPDLADLPHEEQQRIIKMRAFMLTSLGTLLVLVFSDPTIALMTEIGDRMSISPFYVAFVLAPIASNASELVAAKDMALKRTAKHQENAMKVLEGAACMNNTFCLATLLVLVWLRELPWSFVAETTSILLIEVVIAIMVSLKKVQTLGEGFIVLTLYPLSLMVVAFMENCLGFD